MKKLSVIFGEKETEQWRGLAKKFGLSLSNEEDAARFFGIIANSIESVTTAIVDNNETIMAVSSDGSEEREVIFPIISPDSKTRRSRKFGLIRGGLKPADAQNDSQDPHTP